ncbi:MAG: T9SS type A sorting domain-containing protein [Bacteroidota bacterium]
MSTSWRGSLACFLLVVCAYAPSANAGEIVRTGAQLPMLLGETPASLVAYAYRSGQWTPVPVQVDEREWLDIVVSFAGRDFAGCTDPDCTAGIGLVEVLEYTDPDSYIGPDSNPAFDEDDELVFMARFAGDAAPAGWHPDGVVTSTRTGVAAGDGAVYLYVASGNADPSAGVDLVDYQFALSAGMFPDAYEFEAIEGGNNGQPTGTDLGANPETSTIETAAYRTVFDDRWIQNELYVKSGFGLGPDLLDRAQIRFAPGVCDRTEWTASAGAGTTVANIDGPVRAIRVVRGFNSGPLTTRTHYFYETDIVAVTDLRVHPVPSLMDLMDYAPTLTGATYDNAENIALPIDARPDGDVEGTRVVGAPFWETVNAPGRSVTTALQVVTDWNDLVTLTSYYAEGSAVQACTGDATDRGTSGLYVQQGLDETDPRRRGYWTIAGLRRMRLAPTATSRSDAEAFASNAFAYTTASSYYGPTPTRRFDGSASAGGGVAPPSDLPEPPSPPPSPPPPNPDPEGADLSITYDGTTAVVTNLGPQTATNAVATFQGARGPVTFRLPPLAVGALVSQRVAPADGCVRVQAGNQADPDPANNEACDGEEPPPPPPPPPPPGNDGADLRITYDGRTAVVANLGPDTSTGAEASYRSRWRLVSLSLPSLAPGQQVSQRVTNAVDGCVQVTPGNQDDPDASNNEACVGGRATPGRATASSTGLPDEVMLDAAYPNPFSETTTLRYGLPVASEVRLVVLDALGREVTRLADGPQEPGWHVTRFDGHRLPSGIYVVQLASEQGSVTQRLVLLR